MDTSRSAVVSTRRERIATLARQSPKMALTSLNHHLDLNLLQEAYRLTRKGGATGVDGRTAAEYEKNLGENLQSLLDRAQSGLYRAPPVRRVHIPKGNGTETRPIGIPTIEDKVLQRAVVMLLEPIYEVDFLDGSYGFRPGRSAHDALAAIWTEVTQTAGSWVLEVDLRKFFDTLSHAKLRELLSLRVRDGVILRLIGKWLNAGVLEAGRVTHSDLGTPQGGVISPLLSNVFLHYVVDLWFEHEVKPKLHNRAKLVRYADDFVMLFKTEHAARTVMSLLPARLAEYGLTLHPEKTQLVYFRRPDKEPPKAGPWLGPKTFDFLGFTHYWKQNHKGRWIMYRKTTKGRLSRAIKQIAIWCQKNRCAPISDQCKIIGRKMHGHYAYFGITGNQQSLKRFHLGVCRAWQKWLNRRSQGRAMTWERMNRVLDRWSLPRPRIVHSIYAT